MKKGSIFGFNLLLVSFLFVSSTLAQDSPQWHLPNGAKARLGKGSISAIAYSPDGNLLAVGTSIGVWIYDVHTGSELDLLTGHTAAIESLAFSLDGNTLASGGGYNDETVRLWDVATWQLKATLTGHTSRVSSVAFSPNGTTLASGSYDRTVRLWEEQTGKHTATLTGHTGTVYSVAFSPDGTTLASGGGYNDETVRLWYVSTGEIKAILTGHISNVYSVAFSPDGTMLASGGGYNDKTVRLWDARTGKPIDTLTGHTNRVSNVAFSPDGTTLASGSSDETIRLWHTNGALKATLMGHKGRVGSVAFSPDGRILACGIWDWLGTGTVYLWDIATKQIIATFVGHTRWVNSVAFSPDGTTLASGAARQDNTVRLWDVATGQHKATLTGHTNSILSVTFSPDGTTLASGSEDGTVLLWNLVPPTDKPPQVSAYDVNQDGIVNLTDLATVGKLFGQTGEGLLGDINSDGIVNILDLVAVSAHLDDTTTPAAPIARRGHQPFFPTPTGVPITPEMAQKWIAMAHTADDGSLTFRRGIANLEALLAMLTPSETALLPNYPNPFNPETWIPYRLAHAADVTLTIYDTKGTQVRRLDLGYQPTGYYTDRAKAAYWDGRNDSGESVTSGVYFYQLCAGNYTALRRMVILK